MQDKPERLGTIHGDRRNQAYLQEVKKRESSSILNTLGDGDSKAYAKVQNEYDNIHVEKKECVGHVQKRVKTALRKLKKENKGIGGKGS